MTNSGSAQGSTNLVGKAAGTNRYSNVSPREARAAARAKVTIDQRRGKTTSAWVKTIATGKVTGKSAGRKTA